MTITWRNDATLKSEITQYLAGYELPELNGLDYPYCLGHVFDDALRHLNLTRSVYDRTGDKAVFDEIARYHLGLPSDTWRFLDQLWAHEIQWNNAARRGLNFIRQFFVKLPPGLYERDIAKIMWKTRIRSITDLETPSDVDLPADLISECHNYIATCLEHLQTQLDTIRVDANIANGCNELSQRGFELTNKRLSILNNAKTSTPAVLLRTKTATASSAVAFKTTTLLSYGAGAKHVGACLLRVMDEH